MPEERRLLTWIIRQTDGLTSPGSAGTIVLCNSALLEHVKVTFQLFKVSLTKASLTGILFTRTDDLYDLYDLLPLHDLDPSGQIDSWSFVI